MATPVSVPLPVRLHWPVQQRCDSAVMRHGERSKTGAGLAQQAPSSAGGHVACTLASHALFAMSRRSSLPADINFSPERSAEVSPIAGVAGRRGVASPRARLSSPSPPPRTWLAQALSAVESGDVTAVKTLLARPGQVNPEVRESAFVCLGERRSTLPLTPGTAVQPD